METQILILFAFIALSASQWIHQRIRYNNSKYTDFMHFLKKESSLFIYNWMFFCEMMSIIIGTIGIIFVLMFLLQYFIYG